MDRGGRSQRLIAEYSATLQADVNCRGYAGILLSARETVNQGGTADSVLFVLDRDFSVRDVLFLRQKASAVKGELT